MKRSVLDGKQRIYDILKNSNIGINGKIYKDERPTDSHLEDIVINSLSMTNDFLQNGVFNVNCYVPKLSVKIKGIEQLKSNHKRQKEIADEILQTLSEVWDDDYVVEIVNHQILTEEKWDFINFRIELLTI